MISSVSNPAIKRVRRLRKARWREQRSLTLVEGAPAVEGALEAGAAFAEVFHTPAAARMRPELLAAMKACRCPIREVSRAVMEHLTSATTAPSVLAVAPITERSLAAARDGDVVLLDRVHDPATAGAVMAAAAGAGFSAAVFTAGSVDAFAPKTMRAARGAHYAMAVVRGVGTDEAVEAMAAGRRVVAPATDGIPPWEADLRGSVAVVVGEGDPPEGCVRLTVPSRSAVTPSLTARAAVVLYEVLRRRGSG